MNLDDFNTNKNIEIKFPMQFIIKPYDKKIQFQCLKIILDYLSKIGYITSEGISFGYIQNTDMIVNIFNAHLLDMHLIWHLNLNYVDYIMPELTIKKIMFEDFFIIKQNSLNRGFVNSLQFNL